MHRATAVLTVLAALALIAALVPAAGSAAAPTQQTGRDGRVSAREYWTPKRMREARPLSVGRAASPDALSGAAIDSLLAPSDPGPAVIDPANSRPARPPAGHGATRITAPQFTSGQVPAEAMTVYPYSANGRLFGTFRGVGGYSCSATVVNSASRNVVLTAGHCLHDLELGWARRVVFVPAYLDNARPFGTWSAGRKVVTRGWFRTQNFHGDYGAVKLSSPSGAVGDVVGEIGLTWNQPREQLFQAIGYPFNRGRTELMWNCISTSAGPDPLDRTRGQADTGIGCDMGGGSSGGGWTIRDGQGVPYVNGVTSYGYKRLKNILFSPYLTGNVAQIVNQADAG